MDLSPVLSAIERFAAAGIWLQLAASTEESTELDQAREILRHSSMRRFPQAELVRAALFNEPWSGRVGSVFPRADSALELAYDAIYAEWLRRELFATAPAMYADLASFVEIRNIARSSPLRVELGITAATTLGVVVAGPWGIAPAALLGLARAAIDLRDRWWRSEKAREDVKMRAADVRLHEAEARIAEARASTNEALLRVARENVNDAAVELATRAAIGGTVDLATSGSVDHISLEPPVET